MSSSAQAYPFTCCAPLEQTDCREDGEPPQPRVPVGTPSSPCLLVAVTGGNEFLAAHSARPLSNEKVVCRLELGVQSYQTLAAECTAGSWEIGGGVAGSSADDQGDDCMYAFALDPQHIRCLQFKDPNLEQTCARLTISCYAVGSSTNLIGQVEVSLSSDLVQQAMKHPAGRAGTLYLKNEIWGRDGGKLSPRKARLFLTIKVSGTDFLQCGVAWVPPPLEELLQSVEDAPVTAPASSDAQLKIGPEGREEGSTMPSPSAAAAACGGEDDASSVSSRSSSSMSGGDADVARSAWGRGVESGEEPHWRERLELAVDSVWTSAVVIILVLVDVVIAVVFDLTAQEGKHMPLEISIIQGVILAGFVAELTLRIVAKRQRFWWSYWNLLDLVVIAGSVAIFVVMTSIAALASDDDAALDSAQSDLSNTKAATTSVRVASRFAIALRMMRILLNMRKAQRFAQGTVRSLVLSLPPPPFQPSFSLCLSLSLCLCLCRCLCLCLCLCLCFCLRLCLCLSVSVCLPACLSVSLRVARALC